MYDLLNNFIGVVPLRFQWIMPICFVILIILLILIFLKFMGVIK